MNEALENYKKTLEYYNKVGYNNQTNFIWAGNMPDLARIFQSETHEELIDKIDMTFMYSINFPPENGEHTGVWIRDGDSPHIREKQIDWLLEKQLQLGVNIFDMPDYIQESKYIHERNKVVRKGKTLSGNFLRTLSISNQILKYLDEPKHILELGAGAGHQARTLLLQLPDCKYTIMDLPETLVFSFAHLKLTFPEKKLLWVTSEEEMDKIDEYDVVFIPAVFADKLKGRSYDLFINTASMGEMRNDVIHYWMDLIQNGLNIKSLFTLNRFLNTVDNNHVGFRVNENECSTSYDHKWEIVNWELEPLYCRCPYIDTLHSRYLEIVATRPVERTEEERYKRSIDLLHEAMYEDWFRLRGFYNDGVMQQRSNVLVNDMTMGGALFKLWESIRMDKNRSNIETMLLYLERITVNHPFEEKFYYEKTLKCL